MATHETKMIKCARDSNAATPICSVPRKNSLSMLPRFRAIHALTTGRVVIAINGTTFFDFFIYNSMWSAAIAYLQSSYRRGFGLGFSLGGHIPMIGTVKFTMVRQYAAIMAFIWAHPGDQHIFSAAHAQSFSVRPRQPR